MKYDLHIHTKYSCDSELEPKKIVKIAIKKGLSGIAITDHNTIKGGLETKKYETNDFKVIIGSEIMTERGEIIGLFLSEEVKSRNVQNVVSEIKKQDGIVVIPHPFDELRRSAFHPKKEDIDFIDCIEGFNSRCIFQKYNKRSLTFAMENSLCMTSGSDAHFSSEIGNGGIITKNHDIKDAIIKKDIIIFGKKSSVVYHLKTKFLKWRNGC